MAATFWNPEKVEAGVFNDAYSYYTTYKNEMMFQPGPNNEGEIYFATKGKRAVYTDIRYSNIGWKVTFKNSSGQIISTLYYLCGGPNMSMVDKREAADGYEYALYKVTLSNMRSRLSAAANEQLKKAGCSITFDACIIVKINGVEQGGMTDAGPAWGTVYTTYDGIVSAQFWSSATREALKSYFGKVVNGIYCTVTLNKGNGIESVNGAGRYCFGTTVTIEAKASKYYYFSSWSGSATSNNNPYTFTIYKDMNYTANAMRDTVPSITTDQIYVSLRDAQEGLVTEQYLAKYAKAYDKEDGVISYGNHGKNSFVIIDYLTTDFTGFAKEGAVTETFRVIDSAGNITLKQMKIHIVNTGVYEEEQILGRVRFISRKHYRNNYGGLPKTSIWRKNKAYQTFLDQIMK